MIKEYKIKINNNEYKCRNRRKNYSKRGIDFWKIWERIRKYSK